MALSLPRRLSLDGAWRRAGSVLIAVHEAESKAKAERDAKPTISTLDGASIPKFVPYIYKSRRPQGKASATHNSSHTVHTRPKHTHVTHLRLLTLLPLGRTATATGAMAAAAAAPAAAAAATPGFIPVVRALVPPPWW